MNLRSYDKADTDANCTLSSYSFKVDTRCYPAKGFPTQAVTES